MLLLFFVEVFLLLMALVPSDISWLLLYRLLSECAVENDVSVLFAKEGIFSLFVGDEDIERDMEAVIIVAFVSSCDNIINLVLVCCLLLLLLLFAIVRQDGQLSSLMI